MSDIITVQMGEVHCAHNPITLETAGVGSCIVTVLYSKKDHTGGMAHAMLPSHSAEDALEENHPLRYVEHSIDAMIKEMESLGVKKDNMTARLIGGAQMFHSEMGKGTGIGKRNIAAAKQKLADEGIAIETQVVGGTVGRCVSINLTTGICEVTTKM